MADKLFYDYTIKKHKWKNTVFKKGIMSWSHREEANTQESDEIYHFLDRLIVDVSFM